jgi:FtsP/CotA-like multicopper oxidase with cupredoxin domain
MKSIVPLFALLAGLAPAQVTVHPFEQPPLLGGASANPAAAAMMTVSAAHPPTCQPQGSLVRNGKIVTASLDLVRANFTIYNPGTNGEDPVVLRSFGGCKAGPVIQVLPGDTLRINLHNKLDAEDPTCAAEPPPGLGLPPGVGCFNTTNLHTHGLHVSPTGNSDNVLLNIAPQTSFPYEINIPADHPAGTFWYHSHRHGSTAMQVAGGSSGVLLIRGDRPYTAPTPSNPHPIADIDTILHTASGAPFPERIFFFQQIPYACFDNDPNNPQGYWQQIYTSNGLFNSGNSKGTGPTAPANSPWICPPPGPNVSRGALENFVLQLDSPSIWDTNGRFTSINGVVQPTITLPAGEIQRWRLLHAGVHDTINLQIVRAAPTAAAAANLIATSQIRGNRQAQKAEVAQLCSATANTLLPQFEIANDGLTRTHLRAIRGDTKAGSTGSNYLQPGYRSDILVAFPSDGDYCLLDQAASESERATSGKGGQGPSSVQLLAYIHVRGGHPVSGDLETYIETALRDANANLPPNVRSGLLSGDLTPWAQFTHLGPPTSTEVQSADFTISKAGFTINGKTYDPDVVNFTRQVDTTDEWQLTSEGEPHIFHIHVNPFEVTDVMQQDMNGNWISIFKPDGTCNAPPDSQGLVNQYCGLYHVFRDTLFIENGYRIIVRTHYDRYIGEFVIHCHILDHEDSGMMLNINLVPDLTAPGGGLGMPGMKHK